MNFLTRFLKVFLAGLLFAALGVLVFYFTVIYGKNVRADLPRSEYLQTVYIVLGSLVGFIFALSLFLALTGMKDTTSLAVHDRIGFIERFRAVMAGLRYRPLSESEDSLIFKPPIVGGLLAEKITLEFRGDTAVINAPRGLLGKIRTRLLSSSS